MVRVILSMTVIDDTSMPATENLDNYGTTIPTVITTNSILTTDGTSMLSVDKGQFMFAISRGTRPCCF